MPGQQILRTIMTWQTAKREQPCAAPDLLPFLLPIPYCLPYHQRPHARLM